MSTRRALELVLLASALLLGAPTLCASAAAQGLEDDGGASWRLEQPAPPPPAPGVPEAPAPIGLGRIGDIEFAPGMTNRGALITAGNPPTIPAGVWEFNGVSWHELSEVCGAGDGRVIWTSTEEFWTISNGRPGQAANARGELPPTRDNTLCRFATNPADPSAPLRVVESFAFPAFEADSYQAMNAGACLSPSDCWFAGEPLPSDSVEAGSFHLHWNGQTLSEEPYPGEGYPVESMQDFEGRLYESVRFGERFRSEVEGEQAPVHVINPEGTSPLFQPLVEGELPIYGTGELPTVLDFLHLSAGEELLWAAAGPQEGAPKKSAQVTVALYAGGGWRQIVGPQATEESGEVPFPEETVTSIAAEPRTESAWIGLDSPQDYAAATSALEAEQPSGALYAHVARVGADGTISSEDEQSLPTEPGVGPKGAAFTMTCPGPHDCWLATTEGWLLHLSTEQEHEQQAAGLTRDTDPAFETLITERPQDRGLPVTPPDTLPPDDSGLLGELTAAPSVAHEQTTKQEASRVTLPLLSHVHSRVLHGSTLELSFHLAVKARLKLIAKRDKQVVAATPTRTLKAGNRSLQLRLDPKRWPTKLQLQSDPLAPLPTVSLNESNETTVSTSLAFPYAGKRGLSGLLP